MPRKSRLCPVGYPVHVIQRGHNRQICFVSDEDVASYAHWLAEGAKKFGVQVHGWVFMTNHVHLLLTPQQPEGVSGLMQYVGRLYVRHYNYKHIRSGALFEGRFKSSLIQDNLYFLTCLKYIELNPVRAGMVTDPANYRWSSYKAHAHGVQAKLWTPHSLYLAMGQSPGERQKRYRELVAQTTGADVVESIRDSVKKGLILGTEKFRAQFEALTGDLP